MTALLVALLALRWRPPRPKPVECVAIDGPCDGHTWLMPESLTGIWLTGNDGRWHLYRPACLEVDVHRTSFRFAGRSASYDDLTRSVFTPERARLGD